MKEEKKKQTQVEYLKEQIKIHEEQLEIQKATFFRIEGACNLLKQQLGVAEKGDE